MGLSFFLHLSSSKTTNISYKLVHPSPLIDFKIYGISCCEVKRHQEFPPKSEFPLSKNQTKWPIELRTLKQEMKSDDDHATMRESNLVWFFDNRLWTEILVSLISLELAPCGKAGSYWLSEVSQTVIGGIGGHWRSLEVID